MLCPLFRYVNKKLPVFVLIPCPQTRNFNGFPGKKARLFPKSDVCLLSATARGGVVVSGTDGDVVRHPRFFYFFKLSSLII